ncbi:hypothetical protein D3C75_1113580 [compost metagenome]
MLLGLNVLFLQIVSGAQRRQELFFVRRAVITAFNIDLHKARERYFGPNCSENSFSGSDIYRQRIQHR